MTVSGGVASPVNVGRDPVRRGNVRLFLIVAVGVLVLLGGMAALYYVHVHSQMRWLWDDYQAGYTVGATLRHNPANEERPCNRAAAPLPDEESKAFFFGCLASYQGEANRYEDVAEYVRVD